MTQISPNQPASRTLRSAAVHSTPVDGEQRLRNVDALRGFALFGILVVNIAFFATAFPWHGIEDPAFSSGLDEGVRWVVALLFELKFYLLFSFLFGYSFTLQLDSADRQGAAFVPRFLRRLGGLFLLGAAHAVLLFHGDILTTYALLGLVLLAVRRIRPRTALIAAGVLIGIVGLQLGLAGLADVSPVTEPAVSIADGQASTVALQGDPGSTIAEHLRSMPQMLGALALVQAPLAMSAFLLGLAAGKRRLLADPLRHVRALRILQWVGFPVGLAGSLPFASTGGTTELNLFALTATVLTAPLLAAAYVATAIRVFHSPRGQRLAGALAPAGRMALTNYLGQSLLCALIFTGWGFGLVGQVTPLTAVLIAVAIFAGQLALSARWLTNHRYGPVEWALRSATNLTRPTWHQPGPVR